MLRAKVKGVTAEVTRGPCMPKMSSGRSEANADRRDVR